MEFVIWISIETKQAQRLLVKVGVAAPQTKPSALGLWDCPKQKRIFKTTFVIKEKASGFVIFSFFLSAGHLGEQDRPGRAGALPPLPPLPPPAAGHAHPSVQHLGQYGYDQPANVPNVYAPTER